MGRWHGIGFPRSSLTGSSGGGGGGRRLRIVRRTRLELEVVRGAFERRPHRKRWRASTNPGRLPRAGSVEGGRRHNRVPGWLADMHGETSGRSARPRVLLQAQAGTRRASTEAPSRSDRPRKKSGAEMAELIRQTRIARPGTRRSDPEFLEGDERGETLTFNLEDEQTPGRSGGHPVTEARRGVDIVKEGKDPRRRAAGAGESSWGPDTRMFFVEAFAATRSGSAETPRDPVGPFAGPWPAHQRVPIRPGRRRPGADSPRRLRAGTRLGACPRTYDSLDFAKVHRWHAATGARAIVRMGGRALGTSFPSWRIARTFPLHKSALLREPDFSLNGHHVPGAR